MLTNQQKAMLARHGFKALWVLKNVIGCDTTIEQNTRTRGETQDTADAVILSKETSCQKYSSGQAASAG